MMALLLLLSDPPDLLRLAHEDIEVRHAAAAELYARGRAALLEARREAPNTEVRGRLDDLLRRLDVEERIRGFGGGNRVSGFALLLRTDRFHGRGPFRLTVEVMNVGSTSRVFPRLAIWDVERPDERTTTSGAAARVWLKRVFGGGGDGFPRSRWRAASGEAGAPVLLRRGESTTYTYVLETRGLPAGDYEARVEVLALGAEESLRSNPVRLLLR